MTTDIPLIPKVPQLLRDAAQVGKLIPFVGAGVSRLAGCPDWEDFANATLNVFIEHGKFNHAQLDQLTHLSPRIKLSIALALQDTTGIPICFRSILHPRPPVECDDGRRIYSYVSKLAKTYVTTNYDEWLDDDVPPSPAQWTSQSAGVEHSPIRRTVYYKPQDLTAANLNQENTVIHLHGSIKYPRGMILTTPNYVEHYANDRRTNEHHEENYVLTFLEHLFRHKTVLFIGYGLAELEILEYIIVKARTTMEAEAPKHFLLQGFYSHERELMVSMRSYYHQCGIELLPFLRDQKNWRQLIDVLEAFAQTVRGSNPMILQQFKEMEALLNEQVER